MDDIIIMVKIATDLKVMMTRLEWYLDKKKMILRTEKTQIFEFKKKEKKMNEIWKWKNEIIEQAKEFNYLK